MLILWQQDSGKLHTSVVRQEVVPVSFTFRFVHTLKKKTSHVLVGRSIFFNFQHTSFHETHEKKSIKTPTKMLNYLFKSGRERVWRKHKLWEMKSPSDKGMRHDRETEWQERGGGGEITHMLLTESQWVLCARWQVPVTCQDESESGWWLSVVMVGIWASTEYQKDSSSW